jgi:hypothetical protein
VWFCEERDAANLKLTDIITLIEKGMADLASLDVKMSKRQSTPPEAIQKIRIQRASMKRVVGMLIELKKPQPDHAKCLSGREVLLDMRVLIGVGLDVRIVTQTDIRRVHTIPITQLHRIESIR